jgi:hypothetical protein
MQNRELSISSIEDMKARRAVTSERERIQALPIRMDYCEYAELIVIPGTDIDGTHRQAWIRCDKIVGDCAKIVEGDLCPRKKVVPRG